MSAPICPTETKNFSDQDLMAIPSNSFANVRLATDQNGIILPDVMNRYIDSLVSAKRLPASPSLNATVSADFNPVTEYAAQMKVVIMQLREEFCYYDSRYRFAINKWMNLVTDGSFKQEANATGELNANMQKYVNISGQLNDKMNLLIQLTRAISNSQYSSSKQKQAEIEELNKQFNDRYASTQAQASKLTDLTSVEGTRKRMVEYTQEKARATDNLLSLYAFLNVVALGVLVYVYKS
jgi:hypothetical protein